MTEQPTLLPHQVYREVWLDQAVQVLVPLFEAKGFKVPPMRVTNGWPSRNARPSKRMRIGETAGAVITEDKVDQVFISPVLHTREEVLETLIHEMAHVVAGVQAQHKGQFVRVINAIGLAGKPTATYAAPELMAAMLNATQHLGPYPHAKITLAETRKKQTTRMVKAQCENCECVIRLANSWIELAAKTSGSLSCPVCQAPGMVIG